MATVSLEQSPGFAFCVDSSYISKVDALLISRKIPAEKQLPIGNATAYLVDRAYQLELMELMKEKRIPFFDEYPHEPLASRADITLMGISRLFDV